ncbi:MAG: hypothetical protein IPN46_12755 [Saprospiraceae bacterium]|nr:hypothetical protein [Saprospiraceae bacterium]
MGTSNGFTNNKSWRFVDKSYNFIDATNAQGEAFPEVYNINNLSTDMKTDFVAVKTGDVNGNVVTNLNDENLESRSSNSVLLSTNNVEFTAGQQIVVPINVAQTDNMSGMQFTVEFDSASLHSQV